MYFLLLCRFLERMNKRLGAYVIFPFIFSQPSFNLYSNWVIAGINIVARQCVNCIGYRFIVWHCWSNYSFRICLCYISASWKMFIVACRWCGVSLLVKFTIESIVEVLILCYMWILMVLLVIGVRLDPNVISAGQFLHLG